MMIRSFSTPSLANQAVTGMIAALDEILIQRAMDALEVDRGTAEQLLRAEVDKRMARVIEEVGLSV